MSKKVITFYDSEKQSHDFPIITPDYGTCSTASNISAKVVTCDDFSLFTGAEITVKFTNVPTTDTITLNVNNSGAKNVDFSACGNKPYDEIKANGCYGFVYDGTSWIYKGSGKGASKEELERIKYYGDKDIIPSDSSYFTVNSTGETITGLTNAGKTMMDLVIPYKINGVKITRLYSGDKFKSILDGATEVRYVTIPNSVTDISNYAFNNCTDLRFINIPNSVKSIGNDAFNNCTRLESISIPNSVTSIGWAAFENCTSLTSIDIPNNVTSIGDDVFNGCTSLKSINIPNSVKRIGVGTFNGCTALNSITIPNSVTDIKEAFSGCTSLARVIIPNSVTYIADSTFSGYTNLTIYCEQGSYAETYANTNNIPVSYTDVKPITLAGQKTAEGGEIFNDYTNNKASTYSHAEGENTIAEIYNSHVEGSHNTTFKIKGYQVISENTSSKVLVLDNVIGINVGDIINYYDSSEEEWKNRIVEAINTEDNSIMLNSAIDFINKRGYPSFPLGKTLSTGVIIINDGFIGSFDIEFEEGLWASHAEGLKNIAGLYAHVEGLGNEARAIGSHAEGNNTQALRVYTHAEGFRTIANAFAAHAEGENTQALGEDSHAEGKNTKALGYCSHASGNGTIAATGTQMVNGKYNIVDNNYKYARIVGNGESDKKRSNAYTLDWDGNAVFAGDVTIKGNEKLKNIKNLYDGTTMGSLRTSSTNEDVGVNSFAEGNQSTASGQAAHAECNQTKATGDYSHAEGNNTTAGALGTHAEGGGSKATGEYSHAEGYWTEARGSFSHAEGEGTLAAGKRSHASGFKTKAMSADQMVSGKYNIEDSEDKYAHIIGNGDSDTNRSNAHTLDWDGNAWYQGNIKIGGTGYDDTNAKTIATIDDIKSNLSTVYKFIGSEYVETLSDYGKKMYKQNTNSKSVGEVYNICSQGNLISGGTFDEVYDKTITINMVSSTEIEISGNSITDLNSSLSVYDELGYFNGVFIDQNNPIDCYRIDYHESTNDNLISIRLKDPIDNYASTPIKGFCSIVNVDLGDNVVWTEKGWDKLAAAVDLSSYASLSTNNTFTGSNTFNGPIVVGTPMSDNHAATRKYADTAVLFKSGGIPIDVTPGSKNADIGISTSYRYYTLYTKGYTPSAPEGYTSEASNVEIVNLYINDDESSSPINTFSADLFMPKTVTLYTADFAPTVKSEAPTGKGVIKFTGDDVINGTFSPSINSVYFIEIVSGTGTGYDYDKKDPSKKPYFGMVHKIEGPQTSNNTNASTVTSCTGDELSAITSPAMGSIRYVSAIGTGDNTSITPGLYFYLGSWKKVALEDTAIISNEFVSGGDSTSINN